VTLPALDEGVLDQISHGSYAFPHDVLGVHEVAGGFVIRALRPLAKSVTALLVDGKELALEHLYRGVWQGFIKTSSVPDYRVKTIYEASSSPWIADDPYRHLPTLGELDLHLISEGRHEKLWEVLGSRVITLSGALGDSVGTAFALWAPNAQAVRVVGDFNHWSGGAHAMRNMGSSGVWELFIPEVASGTKYKYEILTKAGNWVSKIDPLGKYFEHPPLTASIVHESTHRWSDQTWLDARSQRDALKSPMSVYEMHLGSWRPGLDYRSLADELIDYLKELSFTHVEFMPVAEHPFGGSWGYQVTGYFAPTSRFGDPDDFRYLVDRLHQAGIGVIVDWVPAHFPKDEWALSRFDGEPLYEHADPRRGEHPDWGTLIFDFGRNEVRNFLVANALYWFEQFHIDGLRVDAVASMLYLDYSREDGQWLPNKFGGRENLDAITFLQEVNATCYREHPGIMMIAEESTSWGGVSNPTDTGGLGFGFKWNMGWMHDSLEYISKDPMYRKYHHGDLTFSMLYAYDEKFVLPISHDEVVHGKGSMVSKMPGDHWQKFANLRAYLCFMWAHPGKQLLFMGQEFAQASEWSESRGLDWWALDQPANRGIQDLVKSMNRLYLKHPALWELDHEPAGFSWIDGGNADANLLSFVRKDSKGDSLVAVINFSGGPHHDFVLGLPEAGDWEEILNTDSESFGGSGVGNFGLVQALGGSAQGQPHSAVISVPPLGGIWLRPKKAAG
jgi:1,4-alpha-glucan branching enzyme